MFLDKNLNEKLRAKRARKIIIFKFFSGNFSNNQKKTCKKKNKKIVPTDGPLFGISSPVEQGFFGPYTALAYYCYTTGTLPPTCALLVGPWFIWWGPGEHILRGPCQQQKTKKLLHLLVVRDSSVTIFKKKKSRILLLQITWFFIQEIDADFTGVLWCKCRATHILSGAVADFSISSVSRCWQAPGPLE